MIIIAIDTSTDRASLALARDEQVLSELTWHSEQSHTVQLLPGLKYLLEQQKVSAREVQGGVVVATGPGGYSGLRVGISTAKGLAFSLGVPLVGIPTLEVAARPFAITGLPVCPVFEAGRGEVATALYRQREAWCQLLPESITTLENLCAGITEPTLFCGEPTPAMLGYLKEHLGEKAVIPSPAAMLRRAGFLAELGLQRLLKEDYDNPSTLQPVYLRRPPITIPRNKKW